MIFNFTCISLQKYISLETGTVVEIQLKSAPTHWQQLTQPFVEKYGELWPYGVAGLLFNDPNSV